MSDATLVESFVNVVNDPMSAMRVSLLSRQRKNVGFLVGLAGRTTRRHTRAAWLGFEFNSAEGVHSYSLTSRVASNSIVEFGRVQKAEA